MDANLIEIKLPETGFVVSVSTFLTTGQSRELQGLMLQGSKIKPGSTEIGDVPADIFLKMQDKGAELIIKKIVSKEGAELATDNVLEWLYELPISDGNLIYDKVNEVMQSSTLTEEQKKK